MKFNWGLGIAVFYLFFMVVLLFFVVRSTTYDHSLVMDNYYEQDLNYQGHYDKVKNDLSQSESVTVDYEESTQLLQVRFPKSQEQISGHILFFRPSTSSQDFNWPINVNAQKEMQIPTQDFLRGRWILKLDWQDGQLHYYKESEIFL